MTDETSSGSARPDARPAPEPPRTGAPAPLPPQTPVPLPVVSERPRGSRRAGVWIAAGITALIVVACGFSYLVATTVFDSLAGSLDPLEPLPVGIAGPPASVWWSGEGRFVVLQEVTADNELEVVVRDMRTNLDRTLKGYRVVGVEPHAPRIWLVPDDRVLPAADESDVPTASVMDLAWDGIDSPPEELLALRLDQTADPRSDVDARWTAWESPAGYAASVEIDVNTGACPSTIRFSRVGSSLNAWSAKVPTDVVTFEPIGWSASGEYFAVISQLGPAAALKAESEYYGWSGEVTAGVPATETFTSFDPAKFSATARVVVFRVKDGTVASAVPLRVPLRDANSGPARAVWSSQGDSLTLVDLNEHDLPMVQRLLIGSPVQAVETSSTPWTGAFLGQTWIAGVEGDSVLIPSADIPHAARSTDLFSLARDGKVVHLGLTKGGLAARLSSTGSLISLQDQAVDGTWRVYLSDASGGGRVEIISKTGPGATSSDDLP